MTQGTKPYNIIDLTDDEKWSLEVSESEHNTRVRMVYFETKRCRDCSPNRSCWPHVEKMAALSNNKEWSA